MNKLGCFKDQHDYNHLNKNGPTLGQHSRQFPISERGDRGDLGCIGSQPTYRYMNNFDGEYPSRQPPNSERGVRSDLDGEGCRLYGKNNTNSEGFGVGKYNSSSPKNNSNNIENNNNNLNNNYNLKIAGNSQFPSKHKSDHPEQLFGSLNNSSNSKYSTSNDTNSNNFDNNHNLMILAGNSQFPSEHKSDHPDQLFRSTSLAMANTHSDVEQFPLHHSRCKPGQYDQYPGGVVTKKNTTPRRCEISLPRRKLFMNTRVEQ